MTYNYQIVDGDIKFPYCIRLFDKYIEKFTQLKNAVK